MGRNKTNPRNRPASQADIDRAKKQATDDAIHLSIAMFLFVLKDDFDFNAEQLNYAWERIDKLSEEVKEHRINLWDLVNVLRDEYDIYLFKNHDELKKSKKG